MTKRKRRVKKNKDMIMFENKYSDIKIDKEFYNIVSNTKLVLNKLKDIISKKRLTKQDYANINFLNMKVLNKKVTNYLTLPIKFGMKYEIKEWHKITNVIELYQELEHITYYQKVDNIKKENVLKKIDKYLSYLK
jgi:hypothetical protein